MISSLSVLKLAMNTAEQNGKNIAEMLKGSQPAVSLELHLGNTVDLKG
ncbi:YjfB family protein [Aeribacillus sp. FSL K6-2848]